MQQAALVAALGDDVDELFEAMEPWSRAVVDAAMRQMDTTKGDADG